MESESELAGDDEGAWNDWRAWNDWKERTGARNGEQDGKKNNEKKTLPSLSVCTFALSSY